MFDDSGFEDFFRQGLPDAVRVAHRIVGSRTEAEDVAAEAFARALVRWKRLQRLAHRDAWVLRTVINLSIDVVRRRRETVLEHEPTPDPADVALRLALVAALERLPRRQQQVVTLRHLAGWPSQQVADSLGLSPNTVKKHNDRAMAALRRNLRADEEALRAI